MIQEPETKNESEKFAEKTVWTMPRRLIVLGKVSQRDLKKLLSWQAAKDDLEIVAGSVNGQLFIMNQTRLRKWTIRRMFQKPGVESLDQIEVKLPEGP